MTTTVTMAMIGDGDAKESKRFCMRTLNFCMNTITDDQISSGYIFVPMIAEIYAAVQPSHAFLHILLLVSQVHQLQNKVTTR